MNRSRWLLMSGLSMAMIAAAARAGELGVGDKAPALTIAKWVKGDQVDLSKGGPKDVYVVEFWATWCGPCKMSIPHLSELSDHFKSKNVHFVGISDEEGDVVKKFLDDGWDAKMRYAVALDKERATHKAWMEAAGQDGIPCAFVVQSGKIAWIGHPMDGLDVKVAELAGDKEFLKAAKEADEAKKDLMTAAQAGKWKDVVAAADRILKVRPGDAQAGMTKFMVLATKLKDTQAATKWGYELVKNSDDPQLLNQLAWGTLTSKDFADGRDLKLITAAAKKAVELTKEKDGAILDTYARAVWEGGDHKAAIKLQRQAVEVCKDKRMAKELKETLAAYESGKAPKLDSGEDEDEDDHKDKDMDEDKDE